MPKNAPRPVHLPDDVWNRSEVLDLCRAQDADGLFRVARKNGATNESIGYWTGIDPVEISKRILGNGKKGPVRALDRWQRIADGLCMPDHARHALGLATTTPDNAIEVLQPSLHHAERLVTDRDLVMAAEESARFGEWAESANAGRFSVDQLAADLRELSLLYLDGPPVPVFLGARTVRHRAELLLHSHSTPGRARDLYAIAGYACTLLAWISSDFGQLPAADTHGRTAWLCADLADSPELKAWVLSTRSKNAFWGNRLTDAAALAEAGQEYAGSTSVAVLLAAQEADAAASMGRGAAARLALGRAVGHRDAITGSDAVGGLLSCGPARLSNYAAAVHLRIGQPDAALKEADAALSEYVRSGVRVFGTEMQLHVSRALAHVQIGALDAAAEALQPILDAPAEHRLATVAARLHEVTGALADPRFVANREAGTMREAITAFQVESAAPVLPG